MKKNLKLVLFIVIISAFLFIFFEGISSTLIALKDVFNPLEKEGEEVHTKFDGELGWINIPSFENKNLFGPNIYFKTNSQGFRNTNDFSIKVPKDKTRIICCGDSFTLGYGIDNEHTWPDQLTSIDKNIETINMGQVGYGIDQAYLWYMRDGKKFDHNIHIFAFITEDLYRINMDKFSFYKKPMFKLENNELVTKNLPLSRYSSQVIKIKEYLNRIDQFRTYDLFQRIENKIYSLANKEDIRRDDKELRKITLRIFEKLNEVNKQKNSTLIIVHLPEYYECFEFENKSAVWRKWLSDELAKREIIFIDLTHDFKNISPNKLETFFLKDSLHYSNEGNKFVAGVIYNKLKKLKYLEN